MKIGLVLFAVVWIGFIAVIDGVIAYQVRTAIRSTNWVPTEGVVTRSQLKVGRKNSVSFDLAYSYTVNGQQYTGREYQFGPAALPGEKWHAVQAELPVGKRVTVYHDPEAPAQSVMNPGLQPDVLLILLFLTPFNLIAVGLGWMCWGQFTGRREFDPARHVRPTPDGSGYAARLNGLSPLAVFGMSLLAVSFVSIFVVVLLIHSSFGVPPSWPVDGGIWAGILLLCGGIAWWNRHPREFVEGLETHTLPDTSTGKKTVQVPRADVRDVQVDATIARTKGKPRTVHVVALQTADGPVRFAEYPDRRDADALAEWVRERLGLSSGGVGQGV
jgi:Protein of unknown function (DUF3592)